MLADLDRWREPVLDADAMIDVAGAGRFVIRAGSDDLAHVLPTTHSQMHEVIRRHVRAGDTVIDAGANIGGVTVPLAHMVGPTGRVVAVEMMPATAERLRSNIRLNDLTNVEIVERALSDISGKAVEATQPNGLFGQATIGRPYQAVEHCRAISVVTSTLDEVAAGLDKIAMMKMDLEGVEAAALAGAAAMLDRTHAVVFESWSSAEDPAARMLVAAGFEITPIDGRNFLALRVRASDA